MIVRFFLYPHNVSGIGSKYVEVEAEFIPRVGDKVWINDLSSDRQLNFDYESPFTVLEIEHLFDEKGQRVTISVV